MLRTSKFLIIFMIFSAAGCALFEERGNPPEVYGPREQVFYASFDEVWKAVNLVLQAYPLRVSNMDQGIIETDSIRGNRIWSAPYGRETSGSGRAYSLNVRVVKGKSESKPLTKVILLKEAQVQTDFFSDPKQTPSDGLEERTLLYRIGREVQIDRALAKAQKSSNEKSSKQN
jgi:hypothetical protein